jgi:hypothetical protein
MTTTRIHLLRSRVAGIIRFGELSEGVRRELSFGHIGPANPGSPEVVALTCAR